MCEECSNDNKYMRDINAYKILLLALNGECYYCIHRREGAASDFICDGFNDNCIEHSKYQIDTDKVYEDFEYIVREVE